MYLLKRFTLPNEKWVTALEIACKLEMAVKKEASDLITSDTSDGFWNNRRLIYFVLTAMERGR